MQQRITITFISLFISFFVFHACAQDSLRITVNFNAASISQVVNELETKSAYHFYYDNNDFDSTIFSFSGNNLTISFLLGQLFNNTPFHFSIDPATPRIFITKKYFIQPFLPATFWDKETNGLPETTVNVKPDPIFKQKTKLKLEEANKIFEIGVPTGHSGTGNATVAGYIRDGKNGEPMYGATVSVDTLKLTTTTDQFGYYSLTLPKGKHLVSVTSSAMKEVKRQIILYSDGKLDVELRDKIVSLKAVIVTSEKKSNIKNLQMGIAKLSIATIKQVPVVFGEADVLKVVLTLPGVTSVGEASAGFNVRGGSSDQNLILYNDATIYNPTHLFGFFSAFNADVVKSIELYKNAIPEKYGGRLSSVLDVAVKDGNQKNWAGTAGIGPITGKFTLEGPIKKAKTTVVLGGRTTYSNWILHSLRDPEFNKSNVHFYDFNIHTSTVLNSHNSIFLTGYISDDYLKLNGDTTYQYNNKNANLKWKHVFNNHLNAVATAGIDYYNYAVSSKSVPVNGYTLGFNIGQKYFRTDFNYNPNNKHSLSFGISSIYYQLHPGSFLPTGQQSLVATNTVPPEQGVESAIYLGDQIKINSKFSINAGLRYSIFNYLGPHNIYRYVPNVPRTIYSITDTLNYAAGKNIKTYQAPEVRLALRYALNEASSLKLSFNTLEQYIHMLSNTTALSPTDIWKLSDPNIKPQSGQQLSLGWYKNFKNNTIETSIETYYKLIENYIDYKSGAALVLNHHIETEVINSRGKAYGIELLVKKTEGRLNGWFSYTYSRTFLQQDDHIAGETINKGNYYPASFDKPHSLNVIGNYKFSHRYSISSNVVYSTGRPITLPLAIFNLGGASSLYYSQRNQYRVPDYFRVDLSATFEGNHKVHQRFHNSWSVGVYNLTARQNAYSVYFVNTNGQIQGYQLSIFGSAIPFVTYNLKF
jgi:hypothetical protein